MNGKELLKKCEAVGWKVIRIKGSHHVLIHPDYPHQISIPIHGSKDLDIGLLQKILKQAGLK